jgi:ABC-type multidrug transport system ATPase subunit
VILLSTHDISVANEICTQVGVVQDSELAAERSISDDTGTESLLSVFDHDEASMSDIDAVVRGD